MIVDFLTTKYQKHLDDAWGAFEVGNFEKAEQHFRFILKHHEDPLMTALDSVDAHAGLGAISFFHKDFFEATRWYKEAHHLLGLYFAEEWPKRVSWHHPQDRSLMRTIIGLGHLAYHNRRLKTAEALYQQLLDLNPKDELGVKKFIHGLKEGKKFQEVA